MARRGRVDEAARCLQEVLPGGWATSVTRRGSRGQEIRITSPSGSTADLDLVTAPDATPRSVAALAALGYFWMLWDGQKQTWHDKMATTVVVPTSAYPVESWPG